MNQRDRKKKLHVLWRCKYMGKLESSGKNQKDQNTFVFQSFVKFLTFSPPTFFCFTYRARSKFWLLLSLESFSNSLSPRFPSTTSRGPLCYPCFFPPTAPGDVPACVCRAAISGSSICTCSTGALLGGMCPSLISPYAAAFEANTQFLLCFLKTFFHFVIDNK